MEITVSKPVVPDACPSREHSSFSTHHPRSFACLRLITALLCVVIFGVPFVIVLALEFIFSCGRSQRSIIALWIYLGLIWHDVAIVLRRLFPQSYGAIHWCYPHIKSKTISLTFDDAPGDNPALFADLLDVLLEYGIHGTFFCITNLITPEMEPLVRRIVDEGHEITNHMPVDKGYHTLSADNFLQELSSAEVKLEALRDKSKHPSSHRWFRAPNLMMSSCMAQTLKETNRYCVFADVFSGDVLVGNNNLSSRAIDYHVQYVKDRAKPGSIVLFHVPKLKERHQCVEITRRLAVALREMKYECVSLSRLYRVAQEHAGHVHGIN